MDPVTQEQILALAAQIEQNQTTAGQLFVSVSAYMVFMMQCGFAMLTAGSIRTKNTKNVLLKNLLDACIGAVGYYLFGFAFAYGPSKNTFIGHSNFALSEEGVLTAYYFYFFQWTFAATAATIVSGSVAERTSFYAYLGYAFFLTSFVYPVVSHWVWDSCGWAGNFRSDDCTQKLLFGIGMIDFAGCGVVHMVGGFAGLMGAIVVGPRLGRFDAEGNVVPMPGHSATLVTLGTFLLWFGWYGFNPGSALSFSETNADFANVILGSDPPVTQEEMGSSALTAQRCCVTTTLAAAGGGLSVLMLIKFKDHIFDLVATCNGCLAGLVSITSGCYGVQPYAALIIGIIGGGVYVGASVLTLKLKVDDPLDAFPLHGMCGFWGLIAVALFSEKHFQAQAGFSTASWGAFYGGGGKLLGANLVVALAIIAWVCGILGPFFFIFKVLGLLRIPPEMEIIGNDISKHGGTAYPDDAVETAQNNAQSELKDYQKDNFGVDESLNKPNADESAV